MTDIKVIWIPGQLPTKNEIILQARGNKFVANKQKAEFDKHVATYALQQNPGKIKACCFSFLWREKDRRRDPDGFIAGQVFIFDGLQKAGILGNDGWKQVKPPITHHWEVSDEPGVLITLSEIEYQEGNGRQTIKRRKI